MKSVIHLDEKVPNADRRFGSALEYYPATIIIGASRRPALFTPRQIGDALERAKLNPEDMPKPGIWQRLRAWFGR